MKIYLLISLFIVLCCHYSFSQQPNSDSAARALFEKVTGDSMKVSPYYTGSSLDSIRLDLIQGDKTALFRIAPYFDRKDLLTEFLGWHLLQTEKKLIAERLIQENSSFLDSEIKINRTTSSKDFLSFLKFNSDKISFSADADVFLITPLKSREVKYEIRELSATHKNDLASQTLEFLNLDWVKKNGIDKLIAAKEPRALYEVASQLYKSRTRFNTYQYNSKQYTDLLELLTGSDIGVEDEHHKISHHIDKDFDPASKLNLLIYFTKNYQDYKWNDSLKCFSNPNVKVQPLDEEGKYFQLLDSKDDAIAEDAFLKLTTGDVEKVQTLCDEYERADIESNYILPTFPYRFLKQMAILTQYCKSNNIEFSGSNDLIQNIAHLNEKLDFYKRRQLENELISTLTVDNITVFEYWCLVYEKSDNLTYSAGRILDIFYSKNWGKIVNNKKQLDLYLKKSALFYRLFIIGISNNYLVKFTNGDVNTINALKTNNSSDNDIKFQATKAIDTALKKHIFYAASHKYNEGNYDANVINFNDTLSDILKKNIDSADRDEMVSKLISQINYRQIGNALKGIENYKFKSKWEKYTFMERDFGILNCDFDRSEIRKEFLDYYSSHSEFQLYAHYLDKAGIDYKDADQSLNYDKIYDILKYDDVSAFIGGGGGIRDNEVYSIIKLLELTFKTTLGFPKKLCNSANMYSCDSRARAKEWLNYLSKKKLFKLPHNEPVSFNYF